MEDDTALEEKSAAPYIPPELVHHILSFVGKNRATLAACSLVCRSWTQQAYPFVFEELRVDMTNRAPDYPCHCGAAFLELLHMSPRVCACVRELTLLHFGQDDEPNGRKCDEQACRGIDSGLVGQVVRLLPRLVTLSLRVSRFQFVRQESTFWLRDTWARERGSLPSLEKLEIIVLCGPQLVPPILSVFSQIKHLVVSVHGVDENSKHVQEALRLPHTRTALVAVEHLTLQSLPEDLDPLLSALDIAVLSCLTIDNLFNNCKLLEKILRRIGINLVELNFTGSIDDSFSCEVLSSCCPRLESIGLRVMLLEPYLRRLFSRSLKSWSTAMACLRHTPRCLRDVRINISVFKDKLTTHLLSSLDLMLLEDALDTHPAVTALRFRLSVIEPVLEEAKDILMSRLSPRSRRLFSMS